MPKTKISEFSATPGNNTDIDGINIGEGCAPSGINDAIRELMAQLKDFQAGTAGDSFNGPVGTTTAAAGAFTTLSASGVTTLSGLTASTSLALDASKNVISVTNTGTGNNVLATSPTLVTPNLGTPSALVGTNITGTATNFNINGTVGATIPASGAFTTVAASGAVTLSGGTANGIAYLNGSKVLTTGSALSFDGTNFRAVSNARIEGTGVGITGSGDGAEIYSNSGVTYFQGVNRTSSTYIPIIISGGTYIAQTLGGFEQMRLTSTGLGIGTSSPGAKLGVLGADNIASSQTVKVYSNNGLASMGFSYSQISATGDFGIAVNGSTTRSLTLDSSGNLGLGVTPSAWSGYPAMQFTNNYSVSALGTGKNVYYNGSAYTYITSAAASLFQQDSAGKYLWFTAPSGTAGNAISFTQAMTLDASGKLLVGTTTAPGSGYIASFGTSNFVLAGGFSVRNETTGIYSQTDNVLQFQTNNTERARITSGGNLLVGTTTNNASGGVIQVSNGITFPATQSASSDANTLDDYEEGTWTPTAVNVTGVTSTSGSYTKIGRVVCVQGRLSTSTSISCTAGSGYLSGLPFTVATVGSTGGIHTVSSAVATGQIAASGGSGNIYLPTLTTVGAQDFSVTYFV